MSEEVAILKRRLERERKARKKAEEILENKSMELYNANENLRKVNSKLEELVEQRTEDLRKSESRFQTIVETANDIIYRNDVKGYFTYANPTTLETLGYTLKELTEKNYMELVEPNYLEEVQAFYEKQFKEKIVGTYKEFPIVTKNGETVWLGQNVIFLFDEEGMLEQISTVARNITDSKISQTRLQNLIATLQSGVLLEDENRKIALVNQNFCDMFGIPAPPEALKDMDCSNSAEESKGLFKNEKEFINRIEVILTNRKQVLNDELELKDGRIFERDYIPVFIENRYSGHLWNYRDITKQRSTVDAIRRSEEKYRNIIENMNLGLMEVDTEERVQYANHSFCEMCGYEPDEIIGKVASQLFVRGENATAVDEKNQLRKEDVSDAYELAIKNKQGDIKWWLISGAPLFDADGKRKGSIGIHFDITDQKMLEGQLVEAKYIAEESAKAKEVFLANMSHEIRTPMNGIVGMARELGKTSLNKDQSFYLDTIRNAANNLLVILNDILDLSKIEAGKLSVEKVPFEFKKSIKQSCMVLKHKAEEKGLQFDTKVDSGIPEILIGDPYRLNQVMLNLIGNAIKFTEKGSVNMSCSLQKNRGMEKLILIKVKDTGIGMDNEYLDKIFEKFSQEDRSTARKYGGTGLGMNISKQLVELMGGKLFIESEKGKGTTVSINIPFLLPNTGQSVKPQEEKERNYAVLKGKKVLIAEDNELNRLVIETTLGHYGIEMEFATNGKEAISLLEKKSIDLVLMDVQMPVMDGMEACRYIREKIDKELPIIALTANVLKGDKEQYFSAGMSDIVSKPFEEEKLLDVLLKWSEGKHIKAEKSKKHKEESDHLSYSLSKLEEISRGNQEFVDKMLAIFYTESAETIERMQNAFKTDNREKIRRVAHKIKPSLDTLSIDILAKKARELEQINEEKEASKVGEMVNSFCAGLDKIIVMMKA